jgi:hypothetical protein
MAKSLGLRCGAIRHQPGEWRDTGLGTCGLEDLLAEPQGVQPHRRQDMPQTDPCQPDGAGASQTCAPYAARDDAFDPGAAGAARHNAINTFDTVFLLDLSVPPADIRQAHPGMPPTDDSTR